MKVIHLKQDTPEWIDYRRTRIGASDIGAVLGVSPWKTAYQLWEEKVCDIQPFVSESMKHGKAMEAKAIDVYALRNPDAHIERGIVAEHEEIPYIFASFDALVELGGERFCLEIKCPTSKETFEKYKQGLFPAQYESQVQQQMLVAGLDKALLVAFYEGETAELWYQSSPSDIDEIKAYAKDFYQCMLNGVPPELTSKDKVYEERTDEAWEENSTMLKLEMKNLKFAEECVERRKAKLLELSNGKPSQGFGIKVIKSVRQGSVDYKRVPELKGVNLNSYRKEPSVVWSIRVDE